MLPKIAVVEKHCVACGTCLTACPRQAISIPQGIIAMISPARCVGCGKCAAVCPASVITIAEREIAYEKQALV